MLIVIIFSFKPTPLGKKKMPPPPARARARGIFKGFRGSDLKLHTSASFEKLRGK